MKSILLVGLLLLVMTVGVFAQQSLCVAVDSPLSITVNPVLPGHSTGICSRIFNCGPQDRQFKVEFTADTPCGEHLILTSGKVAIEAGHAVVVCCADIQTGCVGDQTVKMTVSAGNDLLATTSAILTVQ